MSQCLQRADVDASALFPGVPAGIGLGSFNRNFSNWARVPYAVINCRSIARALAAVVAGSSRSLSRQVMTACNPFLGFFGLGMISSKGVVKV